LKLSSKSEEQKRARVVKETRETELEEEQNGGMEVSQNEMRETELEEEQKWRSGG